MSKRLTYPLGQQDFRGIIEDGKVYVDKTGLIFSLVHHSKYIFLSRPRRFGKSLLLSTIKYYFEGHKELFKGLEISNKENNWRKHPVFHLQLSATNSRDLNSLPQVISQQFDEWEKSLGTEQKYSDLSSRFRNIIIESVKTYGEKAVVLIDEYDHSLINTLEDSEIHEHNKEILKSVYSILKDMDAYIHFGMLTGVTRFSKAGIFSGLNNITDITFSEEFSAICGFTENEILDNLWPGVETLAEKRECSPQEAYNLLKEAYDGYHFSENLIDIFNPYSVLNCLASGKISNYWIESGTPTFLINKLKESQEPFFELFNEKADTTSLAAVDTAFTSPLALLFQTGYLTIKSYDKKEEVYKLGIPNKEVREGFFTIIWSDFTRKDRMKGIQLTRKMKDLLEQGEPDTFLELLKSFLAGIPYHLTSKSPEIYFENNLFIIFQMMGCDVKSEEPTSWGRIDLTVKTPKYIYVIEIKVDKSAEEALTQIEQKDYALKYRNDDRRIFLIGIDFSSDSRNIIDWKIKED